MFHLEDGFLQGPHFGNLFNQQRVCGLLLLHYHKQLHLRGDFLGKLSCFNIWFWLFLKSDNFVLFQIVIILCSSDLLIRCLSDRSKTKFLGRKKFYGQKSFRVKKFGLKKYFWVKKISGHKLFRVKKKFWSKIFLVKNIYWAK